ncbi:aldo/keto reductase [Phytohabitans suffuscus]|uniref:Oxidoreductase n=1 Tax=Phytohabitans suffuscus TaxID=624315 RepID=A0A6F8YYV8_9ACTN|nr:aldo/keto reductase [Phytohabitans suffuscus]BCB91327.1 oxidoreductase [Phytohabitans suffuscus]
MRKRSIGSLEVSAVGLGCNQFGRKIDAEATKSVIDAALDAGVNFLDTSDRYGYGTAPFSAYGRSEEFIGKALAGRRDKVVLGTKFGNPMGDDPRNRGGGRRWVRIAVEDSLRRLNVDHIDLYQLHRPDPATPILETLAALDELVDEGKVREIGCSNFTAAQLGEAVAVAAGNGLRGFASVQNEYSLLVREPEAEVLPLCVAHGVAFLPYFPLAAGLLTGKYVKGEAPPADSRLANFKPNRPWLDLSDGNLDKAGRLGEWAESRGHTLLELAFAWLVARPGVASVIAGATRPEQVRMNAGTVSWELSAADLAEIDTL